MDYRITFTDRAVADLEAIVRHVSQDSPKAARKLVSSLLEHVDLLASFPNLGVALGYPSKVRKLLHSPYRIYYRVDEGRQAIEILHFWHGARQDPPL